MPIWLSLALAVATGLGAYWLAPVINQQIEYQNNRASHVGKTVDDLNSNMISLSKDVRSFDDSLFYGKEDLRKQRGVTLDKISELQWQLIDVSAMIDREGIHTKSVSTLQKSLKVLYESVQNAKVPQDQENVISAMTSVASDAKSVIRDLYKAAHLT